MTVTDKELYDMLARSLLAARVEFDAQTLHEMAKELRELRAFRQQVERVKACGKCGGRGYRMEYEGFQAEPSLVTCEDCKGFPG